MTELPKYSYDKEADVLSISFAQEKATAAVELNPNESYPFTAPSVIA